MKPRRSPAGKSGRTASTYEPAMVWLTGTRSRSTSTVDGARCGWIVIVEVWLSSV
jgi:hypothetical protein